MRDIQAIRTLRSIATLVLMVTSVLGGLVLIFGGFMQTAVGPFGETTLRFGFNLVGIVAGIGIALLGALAWSICEVFASMALSMLVLRDYYEQKLEEGIVDNEDDYEVDSEVDNAEDAEYVEQ